MNKSHLLWKRAFLVLLTILLILGLAACSTNHSNIDLSQYLGKTLPEIESALGIEFTDMSQYRGFENTYRAEKRDGEFDCVIDSTGKVIRIHVLSSGKNGYSIFGVTSDMDAETANEILTQSGISHVFDTVWCCSNEDDAVIQEGLGWSLEKDSAILEEALFRALIEENFTYQYDDSAGAYYIGNGQVVEYFYDSFPQFVYDYESLSAYQQSSVSEILDGRYIAVSGTITGIDPDGKVTVLCEDEEASEAAGLLQPMIGFAELYLTPEQAPLLGELSVDDSILAFGRVDTSSYYSLIYGIFRLESSIVLSVSGEDLEIPFIRTSYPGLTTFNEDGSIKTSLSGADVEYSHQAIKDVLYGTMPFLNQETGESQYITEIDALCGTAFEPVLSAIQFTSVDFDQDGAFEAVVELTDNTDGWMLVLRYYDKTVYGYGFVSRAMAEIHTNGVVFGSPGALDSDRYVLQFNEAEISTSSANSQVAEGEAVWYDFTQANITGVWKDPSVQGYVDPMQQEYDRACNLLANGDYNSALSIFASLDDYKDSKRHVDGIRCINYAKQVSNAITTQYYSLRLVGINVYCEYSPEDYTFSVIWEVPNSGLFGQLSSLGVAAGEEVTWSQDGCETQAEKIYYDYFMPEGYTGIVCEYSIRDMANDTYLTGTYAIRDDEVGIQAYG